MTKETLLKYNWFVDNEYLDQYLTLVNAQYTGDRLEAHHIIPVCYYKLRFAGLVGVDYRALANHDIFEEWVYLSKEAHIEAHRLLTLCTVGVLQERLTLAYCSLSRQDYSSYLEEYGAHKPLSKKQRKKVINEIAKEIWYADKSISWEDCKAKATVIYSNREIDN